jgi:Uma2 family endonuclease
MISMNAATTGTSEARLAERHRLGHDRWDEVWGGTVHMVPPPSLDHQGVGTDLVPILAPAAKARGLWLRYETGLFLDDEDYRVPDLIVFDPRHASRRGVEGHAELVIEILSPGDESRAKLGFYAACAVREVWLVDPERRTVELFTLGPDGYARAAGDVVRSTVLDLALATVEGPRLRVGDELI